MTGAALSIHPRCLFLVILVAPILGLTIKLAGTHGAAPKEPGKKEEVIPQCLPESRTKRNLSRVLRKSTALPSAPRVSVGLAALALAAFPLSRKRRVVDRRAKHKPGY